eukprot:CAMPEP_0114345020 /NCGR_PEP_ID=MMETSP0101-20121206/11879_1 /TAXON_ID=38822 ORGANISM="Pteridomonas danica, Strain PT" /NCGR_SAMPLE_ID=MMETSP0101 /ASSEMBLY_ACC=CAM_ASM_000211 /LENGTH=176 /DNA_ID=CAMNT_0001480705 /DNA_START=1124 /DNA_END=1654 /DNA_ORIENTATION=+
MAVKATMVKEGLATPNWMMMMEDMKEEVERGQDRLAASVTCCFMETAVMMTMTDTSQDMPSLHHLFRGLVKEKVVVKAVSVIIVVALVILLLSVPLLVQETNAIIVGNMATALLRAPPHELAKAKVKVKVSMAVTVMAKGRAKALDSLVEKVKAKVGAKEHLLLEIDENNQTESRE